MTKATKALKMAPGDAANPAVRCVLKELSKQLYGPIGDEEIERVFKFFDYKCPYTGKDLKQAYLNNNKPKAYDMDHIYGQNKDNCGLNALGNILFVDSAANNAKKKRNFKDFLRNDTDFFGNLPKQVREERIKKIEEYQKHFGYDHAKYKKTLSPLLDDFYNKITEEIRDKATEICKLVYVINNKSQAKLDDFESKLLSEGFSVNTSYQYRKAIGKLLKENKIQIDAFEKEIVNYANVQSKTAPNAKQDHGTTRNAIAQYRKLILKHKMVWIWYNN